MQPMLIQHDLSVVPYNTTETGCDAYAYLEQQGFTLTNDVIAQSEDKRIKIVVEKDYCEPANYLFYIVFAYFGSHEIYICENQMTVAELIRRYGLKK